RHVPSFCDELRTVAEEPDAILTADQNCSVCTLTSVWVQSLTCPSYVKLKSRRPGRPAHPRQFSCCFVLLQRQRVRVDRHDAFALSDRFGSSFKNTTVQQK